MANKRDTIDSSFSAHCPRCGNTEWYFGISDDARMCTNLQCQYVHWLRGPQKSEMVALRNNYPENLDRQKRDRVRALVHALIASHQQYTVFDEEGNGRVAEFTASLAYDDLRKFKWNSLVNVAEQIDKEIENIK